MHDDLKKRGSELIAQCERGIQDLLKKAVASRKYRVVIELSPVAKALQELAASMAISSNKDQGAPATKSAGLPPGSAGQDTGPRITKRPGEHPKFCRRNGQLVKVGWSKREKKEYRHRMPRQALDAFVTALQRIGADGNVFRTEELIPVTDPASNIEVADYQVYVGLAWLRDRELVKQHGRQGYSLPRAEALTQAVDAAWNQLPEDHS